MATAEETLIRPVPIAKLWHDDIRLPPDGWLWARTNEAAEYIIRTNYVTEASLDHDLGLHNSNPYEEDAPLRMGQGEETGYDLVKWMLVDPKHRIPPKVTIHSWNVAGAKRMAAALEPHTNVIIEPYVIS